MSASRMPTLAPDWLRATARLTANVDLPTPPLPEATATRFFTLGRIPAPVVSRPLVTAVRLIETWPTPSRVLIASTQASLS